MRKKLTYDDYKRDVLIYLVIGLTSLGLNLMKVGFFEYELVRGFSIGFLLIGTYMMGIFLLKHKDEDFKDSLTVGYQDERLKNEADKDKAQLYMAMLALTTILVTVSIFKDFSFKLGGGILLWCNILGYVGMKLKRTFRR